MEQMALNGDTDLDEERAVEKFLRCVPKKYEQLVLSIETLLDFRQLTIEDVTGRLKAAQDRERAPESEAAAGKLLYTAEQWRAFEKKEEGAGSSRDGDRRRRPRGGKKNKAKGGDQGGGADRGGEKAGEAIGGGIATISASIAIVPATGHAIAPNLVAIVVVRRTWRRLMKTTRCSSRAGSRSSMRTAARGKL